ncbi:MAG TPA: efflux RND transporter periplasmic adaptor subunit [Vitreimonas sp.]|uniref:efflux RND transporter periplasmic adaptor subunit n=1 Tax=Vitreimonas sp. TaxID=3069702 RepID=UPI002D3BB3CC|nr:efflux RND transporter periplasmic adaptor subunit [Vitreimonas sp.]HYD88298.1 efflux RND transporter periplasmic adaptor subunit [Vitreimonas sp.]
MLGFFRRYSFAAVVAAALGLMALVVAGKALLSSGGGEGAAKAATSGPGRAGGLGAPGGGAIVLAATATMHVFTDGLQALGTAQARESIVLTPKVADTIRSIRFDSGDRVRRGQVLVEMSSVEQAADLAEVRAAHQAAQDELRRYQELYDRGFASQARLDTVRAAAEAAEARLNAGGSRIADRTIRAPFAGIVGLRTASPGQYMRPGDQIGTLDDVSEIKLDFDVPETQIARVRAGVEITARTAAYPDRAFSGRISNVDSRVDPTTRTVRVRAILPNEDEALRPGMLLTVDVRSNPREALAVPEIAILDRADGAYVYRIAAAEGAQLAELVRIQTGARAGGMAEVLDGLNPGDRVVTEGLQSVRPGQPVQIAAPAGDAAQAPQLRPRG